MKKFWKESRTLTVALSLLLCGMIGIVWATEECYSCGGSWEDADNAHRDANEMDEQYAEERDYNDDFLATILFCNAYCEGNSYQAGFDMHLEDASDWRDTAASSAATASTMEASGDEHMQTGEETYCEENGGSSCWTAQQYYGWAEDAYGGAYNNFEVAYENEVTTQAPGGRRESLQYAWSFLIGPRDKPWPNKKCQHEGEY